MNEAKPLQTHRQPKLGISKCRSKARRRSKLLIADPSQLRNAETLRRIIPNCIILSTSVIIPPRSPNIAKIALELKNKPEFAGKSHVRVNVTKKVRQSHRQCELKASFLDSPMSLLHLVICQFNVYTNCLSKGERAHA